MTLFKHNNIEYFGEVAMIIDFHSHILPGIDDGSRNIDTSLAILDTCSSNGVDLMVATPHFYADSDRIDTFLNNRKEAYDLVMSKRTDDMPQIKLGAEVAFFSGISKADKIEALTIEGTNYLLLEMPFITWTPLMIKEVKSLIYDRHFNIILAHLERFMKLKNNKANVEAIMELPVTVQINAESLLDWKQRGALVKMFKNDKAHLLGSDCHGMHHRVPNLWEGRAVLEKKLGTDFIAKLDKNGEDIFNI